MRIQSVRSEIYSLRARTALACAALGNQDKSMYQTVARQMSQRAHKENLGWIIGVSHLVRATLAQMDNQPEQTTSELEQAYKRFSKADMQLHLNVVKIRQGQIIKGDQGQSLKNDCQSYMKKQQVANPNALIGMISPGF